MFVTFIHLTTAEKSISTGISIIEQLHKRGYDHGTNVFTLEITL